MSDGKINAMRNGRKSDYLDKITIKIDHVYDKYIDNLNKIIDINKELKKLKIKFFGFTIYKNTNEYIRLENKYNSLIDKKKFLDDLMIEFKKEYKDSLEKPLRDF